MSAFAEYSEYDGLGLAALVQREEVAPAELVEAAIRAIESIDPQLNAVVHKMYDHARQAAAGPLPDGPFRGVPFLLKDLLNWIAGVPSTAGSRALRNFVPTEDSEMVRRFRAAGLVFVGRTNTPELGLMPVTEPVLFGPTANPWDPSRTPSGSSGGSAAAVAARLVPLASGSDGGGSIRTPASACGVFGLKPSRGRTPAGPHLGDIWHGAVCEHVLTRSVRDSAAMLDAVAGPDVGAPYFAPPPARPFLDEVGAVPGTLRIAFTTASLLGSHVDRDCIDAVHQTAALLEDLGHQVVEAAPTIDRMRFLRAYVTLVCCETATDLGEIVAAVGPRAASQVEPVTRIMARIGRATRADELSLALRYLDRETRRIAAFFETHDLLLSPTLAKPPLPTGALRPSPIETTLLRGIDAVGIGAVLKRLPLIEASSADVFDFSAYTAVFNATGQPAMSVPLAWNTQGLPIGLHFAARYGDEATLFRLAAQLEAARPWAQRRPPICAA